MRVETKKKLRGREGQDQREGGGKGQKVSYANRRPCRHEGD